MSTSALTKRELATTAVREYVIVSPTATGPNVSADLKYSTLGATTGVTIVVVHAAVVLPTGQTGLVTTAVLLTFPAVTSVDVTV